jgi:hypothetical protein
MNDFVATAGSPKDFIFITAGQRPAERKVSRENCLKGRIVSRILSPAFQAVGADMASPYRGSLTHGYENKALRASIERCNNIVKNYKLLRAKDVREETPEVFSVNNPRIYLGGKQDTLLSVTSYRSGTKACLAPTWGYVWSCSEECKKDANSSERAVSNSVGQRPTWKMHSTNLALQGRKLLFDSLSPLQGLVNVMRSVRRALPYAIANRSFRAIYCHSIIFRTRLGYASDAGLREDVLPPPDKSGGYSQATPPDLGVQYPIYKK